MHFNFARSAMSFTFSEAPSTACQLSSRVVASFPGLSIIRHSTLGIAENHTYITVRTHKFS